MGKGKKLLPAFQSPIPLTPEELEEELHYQQKEIKLLQKKAWSYYCRWQQGDPSAHSTFLSYKHQLESYGLVFNKPRTLRNHVAGPVALPPPDWFSWEVPPLPGHRTHPKFH